MRRRHRRLSSSTPCLILILLVLAQVVSALDHGVQTPAERRHPRLRRAEKKRQLEIILGSPDDPKATIIDSSSGNGEGLLAQLFGDQSSTAIGSSTFTSVSSQSSSISTSSGSSSAESSSNGVSRPAGSTPGPAEINNSSFAPSSTDGGLLGALLGTPAAEPDFVPSSSASLSSSALPPSSSSSQSTDSSVQPAQAQAISSSPSDVPTSSVSSESSTTTDRGLLGGLLGGSEPTSSVVAPPADQPTSSPSPTSTGGLLDGVLGGNEPSSAAAPESSSGSYAGSNAESTSSTGLEPSSGPSSPEPSAESPPPAPSTSTGGGLLDGIFNPPSSAAPIESPSASELVFGSSTFEVFPTPTTPPSEPSTSDVVSSGPIDGLSDFGQPTAPPVPSSTEVFNPPSSSQDPEPSSGGGLISQIISDILGGSSTLSAPFEEPSQPPYEQPSRSVDPGDGEITSSASQPTSSAQDNTSTRVSISDEFPVSSTSFGSEPSRSASAGDSGGSSSTRGELETVSGMPNASGSGVVQFEPSSTSDWVASSTASYDDGYTPSQTWLIVAGTSSASSQAPPPSTSPDPISTSGPGSSTAPLPVTATIPSSIPTMIVPANSVVNQQDVGTGRDSDPVKDDVLISILLSEEEYPWLFVVGSSDATSQLFNTFPVLIATPLNRTSSDVKTYGLMVYQPASWDGREASLLTQYLAYIPSEDFDTLDAYIKNRNSALFQQDGIPGQLAAQINTAYPLAATIDGPGGNKASSSGGSGDSGKTRKIIIGVCVGIGGILWIGLVYWIYKRVKRSNEKSVHRRLSEHMSMFGDFRRSEYGAMGASGAAHRVSQAPSLSPSDIDDRPSSFYASPLENDRSMRQAQGDPFADGPVTGISGYSAYTGATGMTPADSPTNYGPSVFGGSWFAQPPGNVPPVPAMPGRGSPPMRQRQSQNPFEDIVTRSYLTTSGSMDGLSGRRAPGVSKGMISQPVLQANSLEWDEHEGRGFAA